MKNNKLLYVGLVWGLFTVILGVLKINHKLIINDIIILIDVVLWGLYINIVGVLEIRKIFTQRGGHKVRFPC